MPNCETCLLVHALASVAVVVVFLAWLLVGLGLFIAANCMGLLKGGVVSRAVALPIWLAMGPLTLIGLVDGRRA